MDQLTELFTELFKELSNEVFKELLLPLGLPTPPASASAGTQRHPAGAGQKK
jgi:hypothetical protein